MSKHSKVYKELTDTKLAYSRAPLLRLQQIFYITTLALGSQAQERAIELNSLLFKRNDPVTNELRGVRDWRRECSLPFGKRGYKKLHTYIHFSCEAPLSTLKLNSQGSQISYHL